MKSLRQKHIVGLILLTLVCCLTGCKASDYKEAVGLYDAKQYEAAIILFTELGDYKDSQKLLADAKLGRAIECLNNGLYYEAKELFQEYSDEYRDTDKYVDTSGYNYACSYYILSQYLQSRGDLTFNAEENYSVLVNDTDSGASIYIGYEGSEYYSVSRQDSTNPFAREYVAHFNNFFFYIPAPIGDTPTIPNYFEWYYAQSDILKGYESIARANGVLEPSNWFELSEGDSGNLRLKGLLYDENFQTSQANTAYVEKLIPYFGQVLDYLDIGLSLRDFGFNDLQEAIDNFG